MSAENPAQQPQQPQAHPIHADRMRSLSLVVGRTLEHKDKRRRGEQWHFFRTENGKKVGKVDITDDMLGRWEEVARRMASRIPASSPLYEEAQRQISRLDEYNAVQKAAEIEKLNHMWDLGVEE